MGQKVNPNGFRVGVIRDWNTRWYANKKDFANFLVEDKKIRDYLKNKYFEAGIAKIDIARAANKVTVSIHTARPGMLIGKGGVGALGFIRAHCFFHAAQSRLDFQCFVKVFQRFFRVGTRLAFPKDMCFCEKLFGLRVMLARHARGVGGLGGHLFRLQQRTAGQREDGQQGQPSRNRPESDRIDFIYKLI